jgi:NAD-dependent dihydropyrimidine dehydrogenase PreA subunit
MEINMRALSYLNNNTLRLDKEKCIGCGRCIEVCPHAVFSIEDKKARIINKRYCMECGACSKNCPSDAIYVDAGVGCAAAVITGILTGSEPVCGCSTDENKTGCC